MEKVEQPTAKPLENCKRMAFNTLYQSGRWKFVCGMKSILDPRTVPYFYLGFYDFSFEMVLKTMRIFMIMDEKISGIIIYIAGSSYVVIGGAFIAAGVFLGWLSFDSHALFKIITWLSVYVSSLILMVRAAFGRSLKNKLKLWCSCFILHLLLTGFALDQAGIEFVYVMLPELIVLLLQLVAITYLLRDFISNRAE